MKIEGHARNRMRADATNTGVRLHLRPLYSIPMMSVGWDFCLVRDGLQEILYQIVEEGSICFRLWPN